MVSGSKRAWRPDIIAAGFGSGAALFIPFIAHLIRRKGLSRRFSVHRYCAGTADSLRRAIFEVIRSRGLLPVAAKVVAKRLRSAGSGTDFNSFEMLRTPQFYVSFRDDADDGNWRTDGHGAGGSGGRQPESRSGGADGGAFVESRRERSQPRFLGLGFRLTWAASVPCRSAFFLQALA